MQRSFDFSLSVLSFRPFVCLSIGLIKCKLLASTKIQKHKDWQTDRWTDSRAGGRAVSQIDRDTAVLCADIFENTHTLVGTDVPSQKFSFFD